MKKLKAYEHKAQYYETDQMGIVHHSNYIRWFEEARVDLMEQAGFTYKGLEEAGIVSPVLEVNAKYHSMVQFSDTVFITVKSLQYGGIGLKVKYEITDKNSGELRCTGESKHCFLGKDNKLISLKNSNPEYDKLFKNMADLIDASQE